MSDTLTVVDLFAGAGGLSTGIAKACEDLGLTPGEDLELQAVNHDEHAIATHERNHSWADHYHARIEELYPPDVVEPGDVDLLAGGPECTHFSNARGGKPVSDQKRASAWHVLDWIEKLRPTHVLLENVPEFRKWGPIEDGMPTRDGSIFERWIGMLEALGYTVLYDDEADEYGAVLNAADYGDPQSRERLFIMASRDHRPTPPKPTHDDDHPDRPDRRPAADVIDWSDLGSSIWTRDLEHARVQPLAESTMARIAEGIRRHCADWLAPFADAVEAIAPDRLEQLRERVVPAADAPIVADAVEEPFLVATPASAESLRAFCLRQQSGGVPVPAEAPLSTVSTKGAITMATVASKTLIQPKNGLYGGAHSNLAYDPTRRQHHTVTSDPRQGHLLTPTLVRYSHGGATLPPDEPMPTVATENGGTSALTSPYLTPLYSSRSAQRPRTRAVDRPLMTVPASKGAPATLAAPFLVEYYGQSAAAPVDRPLPTVPANDTFALCVPELWPWGLDIRYRMLEPDELKQAQGFPPDYQISGSAKKVQTQQIGNAVPVNLARALTRHLLADETPSLSNYGGGLQPQEDADVPAYTEVADDD